MLTKLGKALLASKLSPDAWYITMTISSTNNRVRVLGKTLRTSLSSVNGIVGISTGLNADLMSTPSSRFTSYPSGGMVLFGSGDTAPTENDTDVEELLTNISATHTSAYSPGVEFDGEQVYLYIDYTVQNNNSSPITVKEVCHYAVVLAGGNAIGDVVQSTGSNYGTVLISRSLVDNPVTIAAGQSGIVRVKFSL